MKEIQNGDQRAKDFAMLASDPRATAMLFSTVEDAGKFFHFLCRFIRFAQEHPSPGNSEMETGTLMASYLGMLLLDVKMVLGPPCTKAGEREYVSRN